MDGASKPAAFRYITLPLIKPMMVTSLSLNCIGSLKFFDLVYNMTHADRTIVPRCLRRELIRRRASITFKYGYAMCDIRCAACVCLIVTLLVKKVIKVETYES